jgi:rRNA maturation RNase YbeY
MDMGSPKGAIAQPLPVPPGTQPISISLRNRSLFSKDKILTIIPGLISDSRFISCANVVWYCQSSLRILEMPTAQSLISFHAADTAVPLTARRKLKAFLKDKFQGAKQPFRQLDYIFCTDDYLLDINIRFLKHDFLTDIITFPLHEPGDPIAGEIYISVDRVRENAKSLKLKQQEEVLRVVFHGALHLLDLKIKPNQTKWPCATWKIPG